MNTKILILIIVILIIAAGIGAYFIFYKPVATPSPQARCGDGICDAKEKANPNLCPEDCSSRLETCGPNSRGYCAASGETCKTGYESIGTSRCRGRSAQCCSPSATAATKTCSEQRGKICPSSQICSGSWLGASDSAFCCSGNCQTSTGTKICSQQNGEICAESQTCSGSWLGASDANKCCQGDCQTISQSSSQTSPFGIMAAFDSSTLTKITATDKIAWAGEKFRDLGAKWSRAAGEKIFWGDIEPTLGGGYNWTTSDQVLKKVYQNGGSGFNMIVIASSQRGKGANADIPSSDEQYFKNFVKALVERYDGDGTNDYDSAIKVKYWQADNEPYPRKWEINGGTMAGYVRFVELLSGSIKEADSGAKIILGTFSLNNTDNISQFSTAVSSMKNKNLFDYIDTHYWNSGNYYKIPVSNARSILDSNGYSSVKMMALEFGTYTGKKGTEGQDTEKEQAKYVIKGFVYNLANGFSMIDWNNLVEWNAYGGDTRSIYNFMGLIADGYNNDSIPAGASRLSYYTYKLMTEKLSGSDWNNIQKVQESDGVYIYKFTKSGKPIWVAWNDNTGEKQITISGLTSSQVEIIEAIPKYESGENVTNYTTAFNFETKTVNGGKITITLGDKPVFAEEMIKY